MRCLYCGTQNSDDELRCQRCARRLPADAARSAPAGYVGATALATAVAPAPYETKPAAAPPPERIQVARQSRLFPDPEGSKVLQFPSTLKPAEPKSRQRRQAPHRPDSQAFLDFLPAAPHAPRT